VVEEEDLENNEKVEVVDEEEGEEEEGSVMEGEEKEDE